MKKLDVPIGDLEIIQRSIARAKVALEKKQADLGVGFSEGVYENKIGFFTSAWCAIVTREGDCHLAGGHHIKLPKHLVEKLDANKLEEKDIEEFLETAKEKPFEELMKDAARELI